MSVRKAAYTMVGASLIPGMLGALKDFLLGHPWIGIPVFTIAVVVVVAGTLWALAYVVFDFVYETIWTKNLWQ